MATWAICCFQGRKSRADPLTWRQLLSYFFQNKAKLTLVSLQIIVACVNVCVKRADSSQVLQFFFIVSREL